MADPRSEPSMEDILASIKRIIADDGPLPRRSYGGAPAAPSAVPPPPAAHVPPPVFPSATTPPPAPASREESVLELTNIAPSQRGRQPWPPVADRPDPRSEDDIPAQRRAIERLRQSEAASAHARAASMAAVEPEPAPVSAPVPVPAAEPLPPAPAIATAATAAIGGLTLEALVRDMLRPMLSEWIDTHMPAIVERLVKQEISGQEDAG